MSKLVEAVTALAARRQGSSARQPATEALFLDRHIFFLVERALDGDAEAAEALTKTEPKTFAGAEVRAKAALALVSRLAQRNAKFEKFACATVTAVRRMRGDLVTAKYDVDRLMSENAVLSAGEESCVEGPA